MMEMDSKPLVPDLNAEDDTPVFDSARFHVLSAFMKDDTGVLLEIVRQFGESIDARLEQLVAAAAARDFAKIAEIAHALKGNGAMLGMARLEKLAAHMETAAKKHAASTTLAYQPLVVEAYCAALTELELALSRQPS